MSAFSTVADLVSHLRASDARYRAAAPAEFLDRNPPPMFITLYFIVTRLLDSLRSIRDHFLSLDPTSQFVDLLEQHLLATETSAVAVGAARGTLRPPFFEGCSPSPLAPSYASSAAAYVSVTEDVGAASASAKRRSSKGKGGRGGGSASGGGGGGSGRGGGGSSGGSGGGGTVGGSGGSGGDGGGSGGSGGGGGGGTGSGGSGARCVGSGGGQCQQQQRRSETPSPQQLREWFLRGASGGSCPYVIRTGDRAGQTCGRLHTQHRCFSRLDDAWRAEFGDDVELPRWADLLKTRIAIFDLDFDAILSAMYALSTSVEGDCASRCFFRDSTTLTPLPAHVLVQLADPSGGPVVARSSTVLPCPAVPSDSLSGLHLPSFSTNLVSTAALQDAMVTTTTPGGSSLYTLTTEPSQTLLWHHRLGHPSLPRLRGMHSRLLVSGLPRSLPPLPPSPAPPCLPCVEGRQRAAPHFSSFPPTTAPLQTLHMDVKGQVVDVLIPWIRTVRLQLRERIGQDLPVLRLHSDRGGEFSSTLLRDFCHGEGILQSFTLPDSPQQNGIAERRIGLVMEPRVSLPETSPTLRWTGEVCDALVFQVMAVEVVVEIMEVVEVGAESGGAEPEGAASSGGSAGASPRLSPQQLREWFVRRACLRSGATGAGGAGGTRVVAGAGGTGGAAATGPGGARTRGTGAAGLGGVEWAGAGDLTGSGATGASGAGAGGAGVGGTGAGGARAAGAGVGGNGAAGTGAVDPRAGGAGGTVRPRPYFVPLLQQVLGTPSSTGPTPPFLCPLPDQSQLTLQPASPLPAPSPYTEQSGGLSERHEPASRPVSPVCTARRAPRSRPPPVPGTHAMTLRPSSVPLCVPLPAPPASSLPEVPDPESDRACAARPTVSCLLATAVTDPFFDPPSIGGECALGTDVLEDRKEDFECLAAAVPRFASMLLAPEGDPDAPDIPTPRSYAEAITGPYSSQWQLAMNAEMASWKSTGTYVDKVPPPGANIVDGMWIFRGVDYFQTFSPTPKMTTLRVLLHVTAQRDYELHSLDFSTAFLQGSLHEEIWLRRPPGFFGTFPAGTQWSLHWPVYGLCQAPREWHNTLRTTLAALGFAPSTADPSLFLRTDTSLPPFYVLVYVDDLIFATADTEALTLVKSELQKRHTCNDLGPSALWLPVLLATAHSSVYQPLALSSTFGRVLRWELGSCLEDGVQLSSPVTQTPPSSNCEAEIYAGAMAAQELRWLTYLLTDLGEQPRSPPVLYVDNKAMIALCQEHRLEHTKKHIALRYFLSRELQQRGQLCLAYVATRANTADVFTEAPPPGDHQRFVTMLGLVPTLPRLLTA
ncbi:unnamed protein product [Closterium sp. NIES-53]